MRILGSNFFGHDSAICLLDTDRREIVAESTERTTRIRHDGGDVSPALRACGLGDVDAVCHGYTSFNTQDGRIVAPLSLAALALGRLARERGLAEEPPSALGRARRAARLLRHAPGLVLRSLGDRARLVARGPRAVGGAEVAAYIGRALRDAGIAHGGVHFYDHHLCHAAAAYHGSPFAPSQPALVFTLDGAGDGHFSKLHLFDGRRRRRLGASRAALFEASGATEYASIGFVYAHFAIALAGNGVEQEGDVTALAAHGRPDAGLYRELREAATASAEGFALDAARLRPFYDDAALTRRARRIGIENFAASVQAWLEDLVVEHLAAARAAHGVDRLCVAGGVAANVAMNLAIFERAGFSGLHVCPAMGDEGVAMGAAILRALDADADVGWLPGRPMPYYGHRVAPEDIAAALGRRPWLAGEDLGDRWPESAGDAIARGEVVAVVSGRMEFGPRALGNRSILANPALESTRDRINLDVKRRPRLQPCCPSVLEEERERLFEASYAHKHMAVAFRMRREFRHRLPGAVHVDGTARAQFVAPEDNPPFHRLLQRVRERTGFGAVLNTSFNRRGRPIVRTAEDALRDFEDCRLDALFIEGVRVVRAGGASPAVG